MSKSREKHEEIEAKSQSGASEAAKKKFTIREKARKVQKNSEGAETKAKREVTQKSEANNEKTEKNSAELQTKLANEANQKAAAQEKKMKADEKGWKEKRD